VPSPRSPTPSPEESANHDPLDEEPPEKRRRAEKRCVTLSFEQEEVVVEFLKTHAAIYDKGDFRQKQLKEAAWNELGESLHILSEDLQLWYRNMRTQLGKLKVRS
jgi:hypothetical protein